MAYVLVVITVFYSSAGVATETRFHEFDNRTACEAAAKRIRTGIETLTGTLGRDILVDCHPKG